MTEILKQGKNRVNKEILCCLVLEIRECDWSSRRCVFNIDFTFSCSVTLRLFSNGLQMMSIYGKKVAHEPLGECASVSHNEEKKKLIDKKF